MQQITASLPFKLVDVVDDLRIALITVYFDCVVEFATSFVKSGEESAEIDAQEMFGMIYLLEGVRDAVRYMTYESSIGKTTNSYTMSVFGDMSMSC